MPTLAGYNRRIKLTVDSTKIDSDLTAFPIAIHLDSTHGEEVFAELGSDANRKKVAFTSSDGITQLYAEVERFNYASSKACYHVSKSGWVMDSASDEIIYMYYNKNAADNSTYIGNTNDAAAHNVWDANFKMVQHFNRDPSSGAPQALDSTNNNHDGISQGAMTSGDLIDGLGLAVAHDLDGTNDFFTVGAAGILHGAANMTIEAIFNCRAAAGNHFIWAEATAVGEILLLRIQAGNVGFYLHDGTWHGVASAGTIGTVNKEYIAGTLHSVNGMSAWIAAAADGTDASTATSTGTIVNADIAYGRTVPNYSNAIIGELRLSNVARSAAWKKATNYSLKNNLLIYGDEETTGNAVFFGCNF